MRSVSAQAFDQVLVLGADLRTVEDQEDDQPPPIHPYAAQPKTPIQSPNEGSRAGVDSYSVSRRREGLEPPPRAKESAYPSADPHPAPPKPPEPKPTPKKAAPPPKPKPPPPAQQYEIRIRHAVEAGPEITLTIWTNWTFDAVREALAKKLGRDDIRRKARFVFKASAGTSPWIAFKDGHLSLNACIQVVSGFHTGPGDCWLGTRWLPSQRAHDARLAS